MLGAKGDPKRRELRADARTAVGFFDVLDFVVKQPNAIGYVRPSFVHREVKALPLAVKKGGEAIVPNGENIQKLRYPLARAYLVYSAAPSTDGVLEFLGWLKGKRGQEVVKGQGYVTVGE